MDNRKLREQKKKKRIALLIISCFVFVLGYYLFDVVSRWYRVPLGLTFYVVTGCVLMAVSGICIGYAIKKLFFTKKKKRTKHIFLDNNSKKH